MSAQAQQLTPFGSALSGAFGAIFSNAVVYPLDTVKTRLQALPTDERPSNEVTQTKRDASAHARLLRRLRKWEMLQMLLRIIKAEGLSGVFKGFSANMINTFSQQFAYFFFHSSLRTALLTRLSTSLSTPQELLLGALAGAFAQIFTIPVSVIALRQQISDSSSSKSLLEVGQEIVAENGWTGLWTGLKPGLVLTVNPAITYGVFERVKGLVLAREGRIGGRLTVGESFWIGVTSKTLATVVTYPYIFAKVRLQAKSSKPKSSSSSSASPPTLGPALTSTGEKGTYAEIASHPASSSAPVIEHNPDLDLEDAEKGTDTVPSLKSTVDVGKKVIDGGAIELLTRVYREKGFLGWYKGLGAQIVKAVLCQGILFVSKDQFESYTILLLALIARLRTRLALNLKKQR